MAHERLRLHGQVGAPGFSGWILGHARRLGLDCAVIETGTACVTAVLTGPPDLLDAMALGCSLGPMDVWVETITREAVAP